MSMSANKPSEADPKLSLTNPSAGSFLLVAASVFAILIVCVWLWAITGRMWFLDAEYAMWSANEEMTRTCAHDEIVILGDSRAKAGLVPTVMGSKVANFALGGGTPIEAYYMLERILQCPKLPTHAIVSFPAIFFGSVGVYWERSALFGFLSFKELEDVRRLSWQLDDPLIYSTSKAKRLFHTLKNLSYAVSTPSYYFPAMVNAGFFMRKKRNTEIMQATLRERGHHPFGKAESADWVVDRSAEFKASPVLHHYFSQLVQRLQERGIRVWFVGMPLNKHTYDTFGPSARESFRAYIHQFSGNDGRFRIVGEIVPWLTSDNFGDGQHLNPKGAAAWSRRVRSEITRLGVETAMAPDWD